MRKLLREPLLHFLVLGAGLFVVHGWLVGSGGYSRDSIVINRGQVEHLAAGFARVHQRPPMRHELDGLVKEAIREEVFYREAVAQGLDRDDVVIRRRLMQKLEFLAQDIDPAPEPTEAQLQDYLRQHPDKFQLEPRYTFRQVYLNPERHGAQLEADAASLLAELPTLKPEAAAARGDAFLLEHRFDATDAGEVRRLFGAEFAATLATLPAGVWQGPVTSGYGTHIVLVEHRDSGRVASLQDVRQQAVREWKYEQQQTANARFYDGLRKRYDVSVERAEGRKNASALAAELRP